MRARNPNIVLRFLKATHFNTLRAFLRLLVRPTIVGNLPTDEAVTVYVLYTRSISDLAVLDLVTAKRCIPSPLSALPEFDETKRFFFIRRSTGFRLKHTAYFLSRRAQRIHEGLMADPDRHISLVPVSIFWARANIKEHSWMRSVVSEDWAISSRLRRIIVSFLARKDVLVHFGKAFLWRQPRMAGRDDEKMLRFMLRSMRVHFKNERFKALGPPIPNKRLLVKALSHNVSTNRTVTSNIPDRTNLSVYTRKILRDMTTRMSYPYLLFLKSFLGFVWKRLYDSIDVQEIERVSDIAATHTLVYIPSHRSHIDYLSLSYCLFERGLAVPYIASGDNLNMFIVGGILRRCGAFFMRRSFRDDPVYGDVFSSYIQDLLKRGQSVEFFIEGTRSRSGLMCLPQFGLLNLIHKSAKSLNERPLTIVPIYIAYESLVERDSYVRELAGESKQNESIVSLLKKVRLLKLFLGKVTLRVAPTIAVREPSVGVSQLSTSALAHQVATRINDSAVFTPVNLVALSLTSCTTASLDSRELRDRVEFCRTLLRIDSLNHDFDVTTDTPSNCVARVVSLGFLESRNSELFLSDANRGMLGWYRNNVIHAFVIPSLIISRMLVSNSELSSESLNSSLSIAIECLCCLYTIEQHPRDIDRWIINLSNAQLIQRHADDLWRTSDFEKPILDRTEFLAELIQPTLQYIDEVVSTIQELDEKHTLADLPGSIANHIRSDQGVIPYNHRIFFNPNFADALLQFLIDSGAICANDDDSLRCGPRLLELKNQIRSCLIAT